MVYLDAAAQSSPTLIREGLDRWHGIDYRRALKREDAEAIYRRFCESDEEQVPPRAPFAITDEQLIRVIPSLDLGATTDFSGGERAQSLIDLGYADTMAALRTHPLIAGFLLGQSLG